MRALPITSAQHFVRQMRRAPGVPNQSVAQLVNLEYPRGVSFSEGTAEFNVLRGCLLHEADTYVLLSTSCYSRSLTSLRAGSSAWCVVGLYYASFFAAKAILAMLGAWLDRNDSWIEVSQANPGSQILNRHVGKYTTKYPTPGARGSHELFWAAYYSGVAQLATWISPGARLAVVPIGSNYKWFVELRNRLNYGPAEALSLIRAFEASYDGNVPKCLPGDLSSAFEVSKAFLIGLKEIGQHCGLATDLYRPRKSRRSALGALVNGTQPLAIRRFGAREAKAIVF